MQSGDERFTIDDLYELSDLVATTWTAGAERDWTARAGTLDWSCLHTADHAVDCVYAPAFFLASRKLDGYPEAGGNLELGEAATPLGLVESLAIATRIVAAVVRDAPPNARAAIFQRPDIQIGTPPDFVPRAATELILHAHDVCLGLGLAFEPSAELCMRLREHTRPWPIWPIRTSAPSGEDGATVAGLGATDDPWGDLLAGSGRARAAP